MKALAIVVLLLSAVLASNEVTKHKKYLKLDARSLQNVTLGNNKFSLSLYKSLLDDSADENVVASPVSVRIALAMMYLGARGRTAQQMAEGLHLPEDHSAVRLDFRQLMSSLRSTKDVDLESANKLYLQSSFNILKDFRRAARKAFGADARELNFTKNPEKARRVINSWVEKRTRKKITGMIGPGVISVDTRMVLVNAVYLKAKWLTPFYSGDTETQAFHVTAEKSVDVSMMQLKTDFGHKHLEEHGFQLLELPYEGDTASMFVLLPDDTDGINALEEKLSTFDLASLFNDLEVEEVLVKLPKFKVSASMDLKEPLKRLGMKDMFDIQAADFSGITGHPDLYITHILQKAFIEVTELGTEAGASTVVIGESRMWKPPPPEFTADHPFMFVIWDKKINTPLFVGKLLNPQ